MKRISLVLVACESGANKQDSAVNVVKVQAVKVDNLPPINVPHVKLSDGRRIAYREQGISKELARHTILVVHGFPSSRLAGIPGIKTRLLEDFGVRLIAYDRPGFGESDPLSRRNLRSSALDMAQIADSLGVEEKFWVVGYSTGGIHAWAAMKYIPDRLAGVSLFAPGGNFYAPNMTKQESHEIWRPLNFRQKLLYRMARWAPSFLPFFCRRMLLENIEKLQNEYLVTVGKDNVLMQQDMFMKALMRDVEESVRQGHAATIAQEFLIQVRPWGFHLSDFRMRKKLPNSGLLYRLKNFWKEEERGWEGFSAPIHIWHGTEDRVVPLGINEFAVRMVPQAVLHRLDEGIKISATEHPTSVGLETLYQAYEQTEKS
ncbi:hypothetical protein GOP47_0029315 [Adiantum capillus-veneris]|nr:hypothetical protein GOP47_0029315 [Adiantum capillus-veneris]